MHQLLETIMISHNPNWGDMQVLLNTLLTVEEKRMVVEKAQAEMKNLYLKEDVEELLPVKKDAKWDPSTSRSQRLIEQYRQLILYRIQHRVPKPRDLSKLYEVRQGLDENASAFYELLCKTARKWTDLDPDEQVND